MSNKMGVPVTTIQGWKKRGIIPPARHAEVLDAARKNGIDLSDLLAKGLRGKRKSGLLPITIEETPIGSGKAWHGLRRATGQSEDDGVPEEEGDDDEDIPSIFCLSPARRMKRRSFLDSVAGMSKKIKWIKRTVGSLWLRRPELRALSATSLRSSGRSPVSPASVMEDKPYGDGDLSDLMDKIKTVEVRGGRHMTPAADGSCRRCLAFVAAIFCQESSPVSAVRLCSVASSPLTAKATTIFLFLIFNGLSDSVSD